jgi:YidC/Oxa1 family membrane protein insertase
MNEKKEMSQETRTLIAAALALLVIIGFSFLYKPQAPPNPPEQQQANTSTQTQATQPGQTAPTTQAAQANAAQQPPIGSQISKIAPLPEKAPTAHAASGEKTISVDGPLYHVEFSNRGAVVRSWLLNKYQDDNKPPRTLDVVHPDASQQYGWPMSILLDDQKEEDAANNGLYDIKGAAAAQSGALHAPAELDFTWSDGHLEVTKHFKFDSSYIAQIQISVTRDGNEIPFSVAWRGGFGDATAYRASLNTYVFYSQNGKLEQLTYKNLGQPKQPDAHKTLTGPMEFVGIDDTYFAAAFLPALETSGPRQGQPATLEADLSVTDWSFERDVVNADGKTDKDYVPQMATGSGRGTPLDLRLFVGPKNLDDLKAIRPPLNQLVQFGWLAIIAEPLFYILRWEHQYISNYGWAIVVLTIAINMVLFPLKIKTLKSAQKMQKVAPEIRQIQDRYKKYSMRDPRKAKMQEEIMAVYSREGINPLGGCIPQLIQLPIWYGLYRMLTYTIELRHAPWILWVHDLSARDQYLILPIVMAITMYIATKMTPMPASDPSQQKMMAIMPIAFGGMFIIFPIASGLTLYILTTNVVAIVQQWFLNRSMPPPAPVKGPGKKK